MFNSPRFGGESKKNPYGNEKVYGLLSYICKRKRNIFRPYNAALTLWFVKSQLSATYEKNPYLLYRLAGDVLHPGKELGEGGRQPLRRP